MEVYVDDALDGQLAKALRPLPATDTGNVYIGNSPYWTIYNFDGSIAEVRISGAAKAFGPVDACEYGIYRPEDINTDCNVNLLDLAEMAMEWASNNNAWLDEGGFAIATDGSEDMLLFMHSTLPSDRLVAMHAENWDGSQWAATTGTHGTFTSKVNMAWNQVYWRKDSWHEDYKGEMFTIGDDGLIRLHTETFAMRIDDIEPITQPVWDARIDRFRVFLDDDGSGTFDWGKGKVFAPIDASTTWTSTAAYDTYICNSFDELNTQTALKWQDIDSRDASLDRYGPFDVEFDGSCAGWPIADEYRNFDEVIVLNQVRDNQNRRERYFYARTGDTYYGLVRWDEHAYENGQWVPVARATAKRTGYIPDFGDFVGFFERAGLNDFLLDTPDVCQSTGVTAGSDLNSDCSVDVDDLNILADSWLSCNSLADNCF